MSSSENKSILEYLFKTKRGWTPTTIIGGSYITLGIVTALPVFFATIMSMSGQRQGNMRHMQKEQIERFWIGVIIIPPMFILGGSLYIIRGKPIYAFMPWIYCASLVCYGASLVVNG
eukprot:555358_1